MLSACGFQQLAHSTGSGQIIKKSMTYKIMRKDMRTGAGDEKKK
jgi:hypothetical protein